MNEIVPFEATHPGVMLGDEIRARNIKQKDISMELSISTTVLNEIIKGKRSITADFAIQLEKCLNITAEYWMNFQTQYDIDKARIKEKNIKKTQEILTWNSLKDLVSIKSFQKIGLINHNLSTNISKIWNIYDVKNIDELITSYSEHKNLALYKKSEKLNNDSINIFGWSKLAQYKTKSEEPNAFNPDIKDELINELKNVFIENNDVIEKTKIILKNRGIKFLILPKFDKTPIDGYSFWSVSNPAIVVTLRKKTLDNFAFTLMHELGHIFLHLIPNHSESFLEIDLPKNKPSEKEIEADNFAKDSLINESIWKNFMKQNHSFNYQTTESNIIEFANKCNLHPSIIFGRYCYETNQFKIKSKINREIN
jgi:HTH-type transcriptional regulator/antitoxin HigA